MANSESRQIDEKLTVVAQIDEHLDQKSAGTDKRRNAFSNLKRELTDDDLRSPGTLRLILRDLDSYEECKSQLDSYKDKYHEKDKNNAILETKLKASNGFDILYSVMLSLGSALIGIVPSIKNEKGEIYYLSGVIAVIGIAILASGILTRVLRAK